MTHVPTIEAPGPTQSSRSRFLGPPFTRAGRWSLRFVVAFVALFALLNVLVAAGQTGGDTIFSNLFLSIPALGAGAAALTAGAFAAFAVVRRRERSVLVLAAMIFGLLVLVFVVGEVASPH